MSIPRGDIGQTEKMLIIEKGHLMHQIKQQQASFILLRFVCKVSRPPVLNTDKILRNAGAP